MLAYPSLPSEPQSCRAGTSPLRYRRRFDHERHGSEQVSRPRPMSIIASSPSTMQRNKRASIYVSDASILLSHRNPVLSPKSPENSVLSPVPSETSESTDHYAILELPFTATRDDVIAAFRRLRVVYFQSDAKKYRALQTAMEVLANPVTRQEYDSTYEPLAVQVSSLGEVMEQTKHGRKDSAHSDRSAAQPMIEEDEEQVMAAERAAARSHDPNWGLKHHQQLYEPVLGTMPYHSFIPILVVYHGLLRHPKLKCRRPVYTGNLAMYSRPE